MQNAHLNLYSAKVSRLTMPLGEAARCLVSASASKLTNNYTYITPPPPFTFRIISITLQKTIQQQFLSVKTSAYLKTVCS